MSESIVRLVAEDFDELISFLDQAFSTTNFDRLLPSAYRRTDASMGCNLAIRRHGDLAAVVGLFPSTMIVGGSRLRLAGIGGVSTGRQYRGQGHMKRLMNAALEAIAAEDFELSLLGGNRQRYGYWGYERCGTSLQFLLSEPCLRHTFPKPPTVSLHPLGNDASDLDAVQRLHEAEACRAERPRELQRDFLRNWRKEALVARDGDGAVVAALSADPQSGDVFELLATDVEAGMQALHAWGAQMGKAVKVMCSPLATPLNRRLWSFAELGDMVNAGNWLVRHWPIVVESVLKLKNQYEPLAEGELVLGFNDGSPSFRVEVNGAHVSCQPSDEEPALCLSQAEMHRLLFGPPQPEMVTSLPPAAGVLRAWCPLPLWLPRPDHV